MANILNPERISCLVLIINSFFFAGSIACPGFGEKTLDDLSPPGDSIVTWESDVSALLTAKCGACHASPNTGGAPATFRLDRYDRASISRRLSNAKSTTLH